MRAALTIAVLLSLQATVALAVADERRDVNFEQVSSILNKYCAGCHNAEDREGEFSVSSFQDLLAGNDKGAVIVAGKPEESKLLQVLTGKTESAMPPKEEPQLMAADIGLLQRWIEQGSLGPADDMTSQKQVFKAPLLTKADLRFHHVGAACSVTSQTIALGKLGQVMLVDTERQSPIWTASGLAGKVNSLRLSADHKSIVAGGGVAGLAGEAVWLSADDGSLLRKFTGHNDTIYCAALSPDGQILATGSYDRTVILWNVASGEILRSLTGHNGAIYDLDFDPSGQLLATASADQTVKLWRVDTGERLDTLGQPEGEQRCVRFSPDGKFVFAAGSDKQIRKWQIVARDKPAINPMLIARYAHESDVLQLHFLDDARLLSSSADRTVKLWQAEQIAALGTVALLDEIPVGMCVGTTPNINLPFLDVRVVALDGQVVTVPPNKLARKLHEQPSTEPAVDPSTIATEQNVSGTISVFNESEPNEQLAEANPIELPAQLVGVLEAANSDVSSAGGARDLFRFHAEQGQVWIFEVDAAQSKSPLDSRLEILDDQGNGVVRTRLQAIRQSYLTFRGKDSTTSDDFRLHKWEDMELDEFLYCNGEVSKLWHYPRGPDSGFRVYPGSGSRHAFFDTTPLAHALGQTTYIVRELADGEEPLPNGLPTFPVLYENDDDSLTQLGKDSRLTFVAPASAGYILSIRDARGFGGDDFRYKVAVRQPVPDFELKLRGNQMELPIQSGREWSVTARRIDGLDGAISVELSGLPEGVIATNPLIIEAGQQEALGSIYLAAPLPESESADEPSKIEVAVTATAFVNGQKVVKTLKEKLTITISEKPEVQLRLVDAQDSQVELDELSIRPGQTVTARVVVTRNGNATRIGFGKEDAGRNLPHGSFVDNTGLNGLLITEEQSDREFFITAAPKVQPGRRQFHLRSDTPGSPTSRPIWLNVLPRD